MAFPEDKVVTQWHAADDSGKLSIAQQAWEDGRRVLDQLETEVYWSDELRKGHLPALNCIMHDFGKSIAMLGFRIRYKKISELWVYVVEVLTWTQVVGMILFLYYHVPLGEK